MIQGQDSLGRRKGGKKGLRREWVGRRVVVLSLNHGGASIVRGTCLLCEGGWVSLLEQNNRVWKSLERLR